jgi:hypothetical protein
MTINEAYKIYTALRLHFTTDNFDIRNGVPPRAPKTGVKTAFSKKLEQMMKQYNYDSEAFVGFLVSNFLSGHEWGAIFEPTGHEVYLEWKKIQERLTYTFTQDIDFLTLQVNKVDDLWKCTGEHPVILKSYCGKKSRLETLVILNKLYKFREQLDEQLKNDPVWASTSRLVYKYSPFVNINKEKFSMIVKKAFNE